MIIGIGPLERGLFELELAVESMEESLRQAEEWAGHARRGYYQMLEHRDQVTESQILEAAETQRKIEEEIEKFRKLIAQQRARLDRVTAPSQDRRTTAA